MTDKVRILDQRCHEQLAEARAELAAVRRALRASADSDAASLAETVMAQRRLLAEATMQRVNNEEVAIKTIRLAHSILNEEDSDA